uniref:Interleukin-1 n=1 Tax=Leptobrachium leishanense TaxID=445787 RepID=A0A8C5M3B2_9ANUR
MAFVPDTDCFLMDSYSEHDGDFYEDFSYDHKKISEPLLCVYCHSSCCRCASGIELEMATEVDSGYSFSKAVVLVVAIERLKKGLISHKGLRAAGSIDLLNDIFVHEEVHVTHVQSTFATNQQYGFVKSTEINLRDPDHKCLAFQKSLGKSRLVAVYLQGANSQIEEKITMSLYKTNKLDASDKKPVTLGLVGRNLYLSCSLVDGQPQLHLETTSNIKTVQNNEFIFLKRETDSETNRFSFESAACPGWYISTSQAENESVQMKPESNQTHFKNFSVFVRN